MFLGMDRRHRLNFVSNLGWIPTKTSRVYGVTVTMTNNKSNQGWLKEILADVQDARKDWPAWAKNEESPSIEGSCPCLYIEPCHYACPCANPVMSGPCERCAGYGSLEQRKAAAKRIAEAIRQYGIQESIKEVNKNLGFPAPSRGKLPENMWFHTLDDAKDFQKRHKDSCLVTTTRNGTTSFSVLYYKNA